MRVMFMRVVRVLSFALAASMVLGCQTTPQDYVALADKISDGEPVPIGELRRAFLARTDLPEQMQRLESLEQQAMQLTEDEPLKLGSLGTAILDIYYGSLTGHYVLMRFYEHLETPEAAAPHRRWFEEIKAAMTVGADGSRSQPYPAMTAIEARMYLISQGTPPVGSIYQTSDAYPFTLMLQTNRESGALTNMHFDLSSVYEASTLQFASVAAAGQFSPFALIGYLARRSDSAAQTAIGGYLSNEGRFDDATEWLRAASRTGNVLANIILARIYWERSNDSTDEEERAGALAEVLENYLHAIALGSGDAMYALGVMYLNGHYGEENQLSGVPLLSQAAAAEHADAAMFLAHLNYVGDVVDKDLDQARSYYVLASELGNPLAMRSYARFLLDREVAQPGDPRAVDWLKALAADDDAEAMILLGNLHARGVAVNQSSRQAVRWFKAAVKAAPGEATVVNEVAWTLTVSDVQGLKRERYALNIMESLMTTNDEARSRPEYLDTWAAALAANGNFERAVARQEEALSAAESLAMDGVLDVLQEHLEAFRSGQTITESAP